MPNKAHHEMNRLAWNAGTKAHNSHKGNQADFFRKGGNTLFSEEAGLLGDIKGQTLLHLQCNSGQDSLSIANHLGTRVTGVDISDEAISFARNLSRNSGIEAQFIRSRRLRFLREQSRALPQRYFPHTAYSVGSRI